MEARKNIRTLADLLEAINEDQLYTPGLVVGLRATARQIALCCNKQPHLISLTELSNLYPQFTRYIHQERGQFRSSAVRACLDHFRILLKRAGCSVSSEEAR